MSQFKDLMHGLDEVEDYLSKKEGAIEWHPDAHKWYLIGYREGIEQGLGLLKDHLDTCTKPLVVQAPAMFGGEPKESVERSCNRHVNCRDAEDAFLNSHPGTLIPLSFHCHDEECEDCFGQ